MGLLKIKQGYNSADLLAWMKYPANASGGVGETVTYSYLNQMAVNSVSGTAMYVQQAQYDAAGRMTLLKLGNPTLQASYAYYNWNTQGGRLQTLNASTMGGSVVQNLSYTYDTVGNVKTIVDAKNSNQKQCFQYDNLDRLAHTAFLKSENEG